MPRPRPVDRLVGPGLLVTSIRADGSRATYYLVLAAPGKGRPLSEVELGTRTGYIGRMLDSYVLWAYGEDNPHIRPDKEGS